MNATRTFLSFLVVFALFLSALSSSFSIALNRNGMENTALLDAVYHTSDPSLSATSSYPEEPMTPEQVEASLKDLQSPVSAGSDMEIGAFETGGDILPVPAIQTESRDSETISDTAVRPEIFFSASKSGVLSGGISFHIKAEKAEGVELLYRREGSPTALYLGRAYRKEPNRWVFFWDSRHVPNSAIGVFPRVKNQYGVYEGGPLRFEVRNLDAAFTSEESLAAKKNIEYFAPEVERIEAEVKQEVGGNEREIKEHITTLVDSYSLKLREHAERATRNLSAEEAMKIRQEIAAQGQKAKEDLRLALEKKSAELRRKASEGYVSEDAKEAIVRESEKVFQNIDREVERIGIKATRAEKREVEHSLAIEAERLDTVIRKKDELVKQRIGLNVFLDSDKDGVSDFDEVSLYATDPLAADSDNDGYVDGAEIRSGFNPLNSALETPIVYEDPKNSGDQDPSILAIHDVVVASASSTPEQNNGRNVLVFSGTAPSNSFATIYIFSTPVIVTVKAESDGSWRYELDKELPDGTHEVYVAITNNSGEIVAKSSPIFFVKEASAVTIINAAGNASSSEEPLLLGIGDILSFILLGFGVLVAAVVLIGLRLNRPHLPPIPPLPPETPPVTPPSR